MKRDAVAPRASLVSDVRARLLDDLHSGSFVAGEKIPNESELARRFNVSRPTVREAIQSLLESGHLRRKRGLGTFVTYAPLYRHALDLTVSYTAMIRDAGMEPAERVLSKTLQRASPEEMDRLALDEGARVLTIERVRTADGTPVVYSLDRVPAALVGPHIDTRRESSLYSFLRAHGVHIHHGTATLLPVIADRTIATRLEVAVGTALLRIEELDVTVDGLPAILSSEWHAPGVFELCVNRRALDEEDAPYRATSMS